MYTPPFNREDDEDRLDADRRGVVAGLRGEPRPASHAVPTAMAAESRDD